MYRQHCSTLQQEARAALEGINHMLHLSDDGCFKPGQLEIIAECACHRSDTWGGLPCGGGKTLIFIACVLLMCEDGKGTIALLSEPLQAIIHEMKEKLPRYGIEVIELKASTRSQACQQLIAGRTERPPAPLVIMRHF